MQLRGMILLPLLLLPWPAWSADLLLFIIQRNKNANEVHYQLRVDERCRPASDTPVSAFWRLLEHSPEKTARLSFFAKMAYGIEDQRVIDHEVSFSLKALEQKRIRAKASLDPQLGTCSATAQTTIQGQWAALERIYVQAEEGWLKPKVIYVDVFGTSLDASAIPVRERVTP